jgi:hypothetical protein
MEEITIIVDDLTEDVILGVAPVSDGDMAKSVYDPTNKEEDAFNYTNFSNTPTTITAQQSTDITTNNGKTGVTNEEQNTINSELEAGMTGEDLVLNVLSVTTAEHGAGTQIATTLYLITDA